MLLTLPERQVPKALKIQAAEFLGIFKRPDFAAGEVEFPDNMSIL